MAESEGKRRRRRDDSGCRRTWDCTDCIRTVRTDMSKVTVGVLALQGAFYEHIQLLKKASQLLTQPQDIPPSQWEFIEVRTPTELDHCDALILPGGESTTISLVAASSNLLEPLRDFVKYTASPFQLSRLAIPGFGFAHAALSAQASSQTNLGYLRWADSPRRIRKSYQARRPGAHRRARCPGESEPLRPPDGKFPGAVGAAFPRGPIKTVLSVQCGVYPSAGG